MCPALSPPPWSLPSCSSKLPTVGDCEVSVCSGLFERVLFLSWSLVSFLGSSFDHSAFPFSRPTGTGRNYRPSPSRPQLPPSPARSPVPMVPSALHRVAVPEAGGQGGAAHRAGEGGLAHTQALGSRKKQVSWGEGLKGGLTVLCF